MIAAIPPPRDTHRLREALQQQAQGDVLLLDRQTRFVGAEKQDDVPDMIVRLGRMACHY